MSEVKLAEKKMKKFEQEFKAKLDEQLKSSAKLTEKSTSQYSVGVGGSTTTKIAEARKLSPREQVELGAVAEKEKIRKKEGEEIVTKDNFTFLFMTRAGQKILLSTPETLQAMSMLFEHPILTAGALWEEIKKDPKEVLLNFTLVYPLAKSVVEEYHASWMLDDPNISNHERLMALNNAADKFGSSVFMIMSTYIGARIVRPSIVRGTASESIEKIINTVKDFKGYKTLAEKAVTRNELIPVTARMAVIPSNSGGQFIGRVLFGGKKVETALVIDVNKAQELNAIYSKPVMDRAIREVNNVTYQAVKTGGCNYGFEEQMVGFYKKPSEVLKSCEGLPQNISQEVLNKTGVPLTVKIGITKVTGSSPEDTIIRLSRAAGVSKRTGNIAVFDKDLGKLFIRKDWKPAAKAWAERNGVKSTDDFIDFVEQERGRIPLKKVLDKDFIRETDRAIKNSNSSALASISKEVPVKPPHDALYTLAPSGEMATEIANSLSQQGDYAVVKYSLSLKGMEKLAPQYCKHAREGTLKFFNDGTLSAYTGGDIHACGTIRAGFESGKVFENSFQFATRWDGMGDTVTALFKGSLTKNQVAEYTSSIEKWMNGALSEKAKKLGVKYEVAYTYSNAPKGTAVEGVLKETGLGLTEVKAALKSK